jgi:hypothetical protein
VVTDDRRTRRLGRAAATHPFAAPRAPDDPLALPPDDVPFEGVPPHLDGPIRGWIGLALKTAVEDHFNSNNANATHFAELVAVRLRLTPSRASQGGWTPYQLALLTVDTPDLLRVVNAVLQLTPDWRRASVLAERLGRVLSMGGSAYEVADVDGFRLVRRLDPVMRDAAADVIADAPETAAGHLRLAWTAAYGLEPDPNEAYAEAVRAVEAAAIPLVVPAATQPTLGSALTTLRGDLTANAPRWQLVLSDQTGAPANI